MERERSEQRLDGDELAVTLTRLPVLRAWMNEDAGGENRCLPPERYGGGKPPTQMQGITDER